MRRWTGGLIILLLLALPGVAAADDASLGRMGEAVQPVHNTQVRMIEEEVNIRVYRYKCEVTATFLFRNDGPATTVLVGFPEGGVDSEWAGGDSLLHDFATELDGKPVTVKREPGLRPDKDPRSYDYPSWLTWEVGFLAGETRRIKNTYWVKNTHNSSGWMETGYVMTTGSLWNGPIGRAKVTMELMDIRPSQLIGVFPGDYEFQGNKLVWDWEGIEPTQDMRLVFDLRGPAPFMSGSLEQLPKLEELMWSNDLTGVLQEITKLRSELNGEAEPLLTYYAALAQEALGQDVAALASWEKLRALAGEPEAEFKPEQSAWSAYADTLYYLGKHYQAAGRLAEIEQLYGWAKQVTAEDEYFWPLSWSPHVARWLEQWLPVGAVVSDSPELTTALEWRPDVQGWQFSVQINDIDADIAFYKSRFQVWYEENGEQHWLVDNNNPDYPLERGYPGIMGMGTGLPFNHLINSLPSNAKLFYKVEVVDAAGNRVSSGTQAGKADENPSQPTDPADPSGGGVSQGNGWQLWLGLVLALSVCASAFRR